MSLYLILSVKYHERQILEVSCKLVYNFVKLFWIDLSLAKITENLFKTVEGSLIPV